MWCGHPRHRPRAGRARRPGHGALASLLLGNRGTKHAPSPEIQCRPSKELSPSPNRRCVALGRTPGRSSSLRAVPPGHPKPRVRGPAALLMQEQWARKLPVARPQRRRGSRNENGDVGRLCPRGEGGEGCSALPPRSKRRGTKGAGYPAHHCRCMPTKRDRASELARQLWKRLPSTPSGWQAASAPVGLLAV